MKIDIWSDTRCPFCYIGKHNFEAALAKFKNKNDIKVEWHSFQLDPNIVTQPEMDSFEYLAKIKGISIDRDELAKILHEIILIDLDDHINFKIKNIKNIHDVLELIYDVAKEQRKVIQTYKAETTTLPQS